MNAFIQLPPEDRRVFFEATASARNMRAQMIEKDFWVCWTLKKLFGLPTIGEHLIFKGGTSLSKVFRVIERFSEDIDVSIDRAFLGFGGSNEPEGGASHKERQRRIDALIAACQRKIADELQPALAAAFRAALRPGEPWSLPSDQDDPDQQTLLFDYPTSFATASPGYVHRAVKIEMGARADHWPAESRMVAPYVAEEFPSGFSEPTCPVKVLSVERTFWEKATILHAEFHRPLDKAMPERFSRHYCDFFEMVRRGVGASGTAKLNLLARVAQHKNLFFKSSWAHYMQAAKGTLRIAPPEHRVKSLREDYGRMQQMFFGEPPRFEEMLAGLCRWEAEFNA